MGGAQVQSLTPIPSKDSGPLKGGWGGGGGGTNTTPFFEPPWQNVEEIRSGCITPAFSVIPNTGTEPDRGTESEAAAQILPSWGPRENAPRKLSTLEYKHVGLTGFASPFKWGTKISSACGSSQVVHEVAKAVKGGYCRLQMPLKLALGVRGDSGWA